MAAAVLLLDKAAPEGATLIYNKEHGLGWLDRRGWTVYFGRPQDIEMKYQVYQHLWERLKGEEIPPFSGQCGIYPRTLLSPGAVMMNAQEMERKRLVEVV